MYEGRFTRQFERATRNADREALLQFIREILEDPERAHGNEPLRHEWAGFRAAQLSGRERVIFRICDECIRKLQQDVHPLACCNAPDTDRMVVTFVDFGDYHASAGRRRLRPAREYKIQESEKQDAE